MGDVIVAFCTSIKHAHNVAGAFAARGVPALAIDGGMSDEERALKIGWLEDGTINVLTSVDLIGEGLNLPAIGAAILLRPTASLTVHLQQIGRAMRPAEGKAAGIVLDHVGNCLRHGPAELAREWCLDGKTRKAANDNAPAWRRCPQCFALFSAGKGGCPQCGAAPALTRKEIEKREGELRELELSRLKREAKREVGKARTLAELEAIGRARGYKNPVYWARCVFDARQSKRSRYAA